MRKDEFLDVMGEIDDKFFKEAQEYLCADYGEIVEPVIMQPKKKSAARFVLPIAASVALVGVLGAVVFFGGRLNTTEPNAEITSDITTKAPDETTEENTEDNNQLREAKYVDYCREYVYERSKDVFSRGEDPLQYRVLDLNFDGTDEILVTTEEIFCPIFVFETPENDPDSDPTFINMIADNLYDKHGGFFEELYPYKEGKYYYYFFHTDNNGADTRALMTIKYDEEKGGYMEGLLSYGVVSYYDTVLPHETFFRNYVDVYDLTSTGEQGITEKEFRELWGKHDKLPPIDEELLKGAENAISINSDYAWAMGKSLDELTEKFGAGTEGKYNSYRFENCSGSFGFETTYNGEDSAPILGNCKKILYIDIKDFIVGEFSTMNYEEFAASCGIEYISLPESNETMYNTWDALFTHPDYKDIVFVMSTVERDVIDETTDFMIDYITSDSEQ